MNTLQGTAAAFLLQMLQQAERIENDYCIAVERTKTHTCITLLPAKLHPTTAAPTKKEANYSNACRRL